MLTRGTMFAGNGEDVVGKRAALEAVKRLLPLEAVTEVAQQAEEVVSAVDSKRAEEQVRLVSALLHCLQPTKRLITQTNFFLRKRQASESGVCKLNAFSLCVPLCLDGCRESRAGDRSVFPSNRLSGNMLSESHVASRCQGFNNECHQRVCMTDALFRYASTSNPAHR